MFEEILKKAEDDPDWIEKSKKRLQELIEPTPQFFKDILSLYRVNLPIYLVPYWVVQEFSDDMVAVATYWVVKYPHTPLGILIASDMWISKIKNPNLAKLKELLHEIGHHLFYEREREYRRRRLEELKNQRITLVRFEIENRIEKWVKDQWKELRKYVNKSRTGWKRGLSFDDVLSQFKYNHDIYKDLYRVE